MYWIISSIKGFLLCLKKMHARILRTALQLTLIHFIGKLSPMTTHTFAFLYFLYFCLLELVPFTLSSSVNITVPLSFCLGSLPCHAHCTFPTLWPWTRSGCSTPSGLDCGSGRSTPSSISTVSSICPTELKAVSKMAPNVPLEMELPGVKIVHAQFNTPMQLYSDDNIMETLQGQVSTALGETPVIR